MKKILLIFAFALALVSKTNAADLALKASPPTPASYWDGFYLGVQGGVVRHDASFNDLSAFSAGASQGTRATSVTGGLVGGYAGYNLQHQSFVYGVEADVSWLAAKAAERWESIFDGGTYWRQSQEVNWLGTFRARAGLAFETTLFFMTGGVAVAEVKNSFNSFCAIVNGCDAGLVVNPFNEFIAGFSESTTRVGWTVGAGFEHMFDAHWSVRGEFRYVDLGRSSAPCKDNGVGLFGGFCSTQLVNPIHGGFSDTLMIGSVGVGYKF